MNFTRKRSREGPQHHPPPKRHDHKVDDKRDAPQAKASSSASAKSTTPQPTTSAPEKKPLPPAPPKTTIVEPEQPQFDVTSAELIADVPGILKLLESIRETSTSMVEKALSPEATTEEGKDVIKDAGRSGFVALARLRSLHRQLHTEVDLRRQQSSSHQDMNFLNSMQVLQSTKYELDAFKSLVESQPSIESVPGLISEEDYQTEAKGRLHGPSDSDTDHSRMLKRLKFEEDRRKSMRTKLKEIPIKQNSLKSALNVETRDLDTMKREIREIGRQVSKLQQSLKLEPITLQQSDPRSNLLPQPLYNLYVQITSWISVFGGDQIEVSVSGVADVAQNERRHKSSKSRDKSKSSSSSASDGRLSSDQCQETHHLSILLQISSSEIKGTVRKVSFIFEYLVNLNIVIVTPLNNEDPRILVNLFPNDDGETSPNPANQFQMLPGTEWLPRRARAYKWAQSLCGLHFHTEPTEVFESSAPISAESRAQLASSLTDTLEVLKRRVTNHFDFNGITSALTSGNIESDSVTRPDAPEVGIMRRWTLQSPKEAQNIMRDATDYFESNHITPTAELKYDPNNSYFLAIFGTRGHPILHVLVSLPPEYPNAHPSFIVFGHKSSQSSEIQRINQALPTLQPSPTVSGKPETLLNYTLSWLKGCINVYDEVIKRGDSSKLAKLETRYHITSWS